MATKCEHCPLRRKDLFAKMNSSQVAEIQRFKVGEMVVDAGTPILLQGSNSPQLYTILHGMGLRYRLLSNGQRQVISFVFPGDFLGLQAGVMGEMGHSVEATTKLTLCVFDRNELWSFIKADPERGFELAWLAAIEEHFMGEALTTVGQRTAVQAIAWALVRIYLRMQASGLTNGNSIKFPFRQQDLADALGLSLVHTNKTIAGLKSKQLLGWADGEVHLHNLKKLAEIGLTTVDLPKERPIL
ncbi:Crp/Fnr family transcriptional regulator [Sulfitobacter sp. F26204]|uniref:Crp/Fnr family transcriptional regulator n=1 Tax=Sulfitobacter sp. F26204 TaxID=2996014 RepID=UPI00225DDB9A|nr:Crp/Fnr family transcriptional regulator [Sulfitobacter sp. F26204]MCX7560194.1 Crp/Fnr family transcriptional regulator [Sulfitobacter sp. F26204]